MKAIAITAALLALTACNNSTAPMASNAETETLRAKVERLENELHTLRQQLFGNIPITNENGKVEWICLDSRSSSPEELNRHLEELARRYENRKKNRLISSPPRHKSAE